MSDTIFETSVPESQPKGQVGELSRRLGTPVEDFLSNASSQQIKQVRITVDTASDSTTYAYDVVGGTVEIKTGSGVSKEDVVDALLEEHNTSPLIRGEVEAEKDAADQILLIGLEPGQDFSFSESDSNLSNTVVQAAQDPDPTGIAKAILQNGSEANASALTARKYEFTHPGSDADIMIESAGQVGRFGGASASALASSINSDGHFGDILDASNPAGEELVIEAKVAGESFEIIDADDMESLDGYTPGDEIEKALAGISISKANLSENAESYKYPGRRGVHVLQDNGGVYVRNGEGASKGDYVYLYLTGAAAGKFSDTRVPGETVLVDPDTLEWRAPQDIEVKGLG